MQRKRPDVETCKARLEEIEARFKLGKLNEAEASAAKLALLCQLRASRWSLRPTARTVIGPAAVFLLVAGFGASVSYVADSPETSVSADTDPAQSSDGEMLASLANYTRSIGSEVPARDADGKMLADVNTMIERLAARLDTQPEDVKGWGMLGWSYLQMERYEQAAAAYARASELDPSSAELKRSYEEAKAKASNSANLQTGAIDKDAPGSSAEKTTASEAPHQSNDAIRSMVDRLADRLESSPRDVEGWTRLMRSRVVLGEREVAATAFHKALEVFKDDFAASSKLTATAIELGLKSE